MNRLDRDPSARRLFQLTEVEGWSIRNLLLCQVSGEFGLRAMITWRNRRRPRCDTPQNDPWMRAYNLFRRKEEADLYCALPEDVAVPSFVTQETWEFPHSLELDVLSGFDATAAEAAVQANGFYLFHSTDNGAAEAEEAGAHPFSAE